jgi:hypothetical protein
MKGILLTCLCLLLTVGANAQQPDGPLTNVAVVKLVKAGFKEKTIISIINSRPAKYKLDTDDLIELKRNGVNEKIILAMLSAQMGTVFLTDDEWSGDPFFRDSKKQSGGDPKSQSSESNIFGSGSNSQSSERTPGGLNGGNQNDSNLNGSATVRIIKPPPSGSGGGAGPTLEKTPTLTNEGVIRLVEAGFSEGTIIKRIEESPVDFDLSPAKLDELFKKRVTDAIIAAMRAAMGK